MWVEREKTGKEANLLRKLIFFTEVCLLNFINSKQ